MKNFLNRLKSLCTPDFLWGLAIAVGIFLRLRQYFVNRSLWVDEAMLAFNIVNRTFSGLTLPLDYNQGAPIGFLFIEKIIILTLGNHDYILRLFPIFSGVLSVYLIYLIAKEHFGNPGMFAVLLFSISASITYYSSELKQYSSDVMFALLLTYLATLCLKQEAKIRSFILLGIVGVIAIWISHPSAFILAGIGLILLVEKILKKAYFQLPWVLGIGMMWGITFLTTYALSLRYLMSNKKLNNYWQGHFMPLPPWDYLEWYKSVFTSLLPDISRNLNQTYLVEGCFVLILIGIVSLFLRSRKIAFLMISPFLMASIASAMQRYPLSGRFIHFLIPFVVLLLAEGLGRIYSICAGINRKAALLVYGLLALIILWGPVTSASRNALTPPMGEDIKPVLAYIQEHMQEKDVIYVHKGSIVPFLYYASSYGFNADNTIIAEVNNKGTKGFISDVKNLKGKNRIWFIFSHVISCDGCKGDRVQYHIQILDQYGIQQDRFEAVKAAVYLYDLNP